jgi:hypothetical protein
MKPQKEPAGPQISIGLSETKRVRIRYAGEEWILPYDVCQMLLSDQKVRDRLREVTRQSMNQCADIVFVVNQEETA